MASNAKSVKSKKSASAKGASARRDEPPAADRGAWREATGVALIGVALLLGYFSVFDSATQAGVVIKSILTGLAGKLCYIVPVIVCWAGVLTAFSGRMRRIKISKVALAALLVLCVCALVHVFWFDQIVSGMRFYTFFNFVGQSYAYKQGGAGVLGALISWPLFWTLGLGQTGAIIVLIMAMLADLVLLRKISLTRLGERVQRRYGEMLNHHQEHAQERRAARGEREQARRRASLDELEKWPDAPKEPSAPEPVPQPEPDRSEMTVPRYHVSEPVISKRAKLPPQPEPVQAESPEQTGEVPEYLSRTARKRKGRGKLSESEKLHIREPEPIYRPEVEQEHADGPLKSGSVAFGEDAPAEDLSAPAEDVQTGAQESPEEPLPGIDGLGEAILPGGETLDGAARGGESEIEEIQPPFDEIIVSGQEEDEKPSAREKTAALKPSARMPIARPAPKPAARPDAPAQAEKRAAQDLGEETYNYPPIDLLAASTPAKVKNREQHDAEKAKTLIETLSSFGISARLIGIAHGPTVTRFELSPAAGVKVSRITSLADDIALNLAAVSVRIEAPIPGKAAVGVEVPNEVAETVPLRDVLESAEARRHPSRLAVALGRDNAGRYIVADLAKMPHVLIAGATGAGKSVCINCIICSILYRATPDEVRLIMIDPKVVELSAYNGIPHLLVPVVTDPKKAASALEWAVSEMTARYKKFAKLGVRDMKGYNQHRPADEPAMPQIVIIIDELADLMMVTPGEVEDSICRLAQLARAAGIHLVIATQRPSVNVITGVIKANIPSRIAFTVASQVDSRTILDVGGAEKLLGRGDMLFAPAGTNKPTRVQGAWVSDDEVHEVVEYIKDLHTADYDEDIIEHMNNAEMSDAEQEEAHSEYDELLPQAVEIVVESGQASISMLQRRLRVGYARAGRLIDEMAARGIVSQAEGAKPRNVLISREQFKSMFEE